MKNCKSTTKMRIIFLLVVSCIGNIQTFENDAVKEDVELYKYLIESLRFDPFLISSQFSDESKQFIDQKIDHFIDLILENENVARTKRSLSNENVFEGNVVDMKLYQTFPRLYVKAMQIFKQGAKFFLVTLEGPKDSVYSKQLVIKQYQNKSFILKAQHELSNGVNLAVMSSESSTLIAVSENIDRDMNIYNFNETHGLEVIQELKHKYAVDVEMWKDKQQNIFMSAVQTMKRTVNETTNEVQMLLYKWNGESFEKFQVFNSYGTKKVTPFLIGDTSYLAMVNSEGRGDEKTYSEILKFNLQRQTYEVFQRLLTNGCSDIQYFRTNFNKELEHFLIVTNDYYDTERKNEFHDNKATSIIYKFVEDYFIPFHSVHIEGVRRWLPIQMETGGNVILLASTPEGLQCLQYDGWRYEKCKTHLKNVSNDTLKDVNAMHYGALQDKNILVIATKNSDEVMVEINSSPEYKVRKLHDELLYWCTDSVKLVDTLSDNILGETRRGDNIEEMDSASQKNSTEQDQLAQDLTTYETQILQFEDSVRKDLQSDNLFKGHSITAKTLIVNGPAIIKSADIDSINNFTVRDILENILDINEGFEIDEEVELEIVDASEPITVGRINNNIPTNLLHTTDDIDFDEFSVSGDVRCDEQLKVAETINDMKFSEEFLLLRDVDQNFENFSLDRLDAKNVRADKLEAFSNNNDSSTPLLSSIDEMKIKNLKIGGYMNGVKISTLNKFALRRFGDQDIVVPCYFNHVNAENLNTERISDKEIPEILVKVTEGAYSINKDVRFTQDLSANNLTAFKFLNSIPVGRDGNIDVLLKDIPEQQSVTGRKKFENLELYDSINLQGKIDGRAFDKLKSFVTIDSNLELEGDKTITGDVIVEEIIRTDNIVSSERLNSLRRVRSEALRLTDVEIPNRLSFFQHLNVDDVFARKINNIDARLLVVNGAKQTQTVRGWKKFRGDLEITGNTEVLKINGIDMNELEMNVLKKDGDQIVDGKHFVKLVAAEGGITSKTSSFGNRPWRDVIRTNGDQSISGTITFSKNVTANSISAQNVDLKGLINNKNFTEILNDAVTKDSKRQISGTKSFGNITIHFLESLKKLGEHDEDGKAVHLSGIDFLKTVSVKNIHFNENLNDIDREEFENFLNEELLELILDGDRKLGNMTVYGDVYVEADRIGDVSLDDFVNNTWKIDESMDFDNVVFNNIVVEQGIEVEGHVENLDLNNVFQNNRTNEISNIMHEKIFNQDLFIQGNVLINGTLNDVRLWELCRSISPSNDEKHLVLKGNAFLAKGPIIKHINGLELEDLIKRTWFKNQIANIEGNMEFENITFFDNIKLKGLLNKVNLTHLEKHYLSKTKQQKITGLHIISNLVTFNESVVTPELFIDGRVNGINLESFMKSVLLNRPQLFEEAIYLENVFADGLDGSYKVNEMDLEHDVMRYDKPNQVIGKKTFNNLEVDVLKVQKNINVQNVDIIKFTTKAVLKNGTFRIMGKPFIKSATFKNDLGLMGNLNAMSFDEKTLLLKRSPQNITGRVSFGTQAETKFKALKVRGLVNNADIEKLVRNQVAKVGDTTFKSDIHFNKNLITNNVNFEGLYSGVNISELLINITKLESLNHQKENYQDLLIMSHALEHSFQDQAFYLNDFKRVFSEHAATLLSIQLQNRDKRIALLACEGDAMNVHLFGWDSDNRIFEHEHSRILGPFPGFSSKVTIRGVDYFYLESEKKEDLNNEEDQVGDYTHTGVLIGIENGTAFDKTPFLTRGTLYLTSFEMTVLNIECLLFIDFEYNINIVCLGEDEQFYLHQNISDEKANMASFMDVNGAPHLITLRRKTPQQDPRVAIWKFNNQTQLFKIHQKIYEGEPEFLSIVSSPYGHFVSVTYDYKRKTLDFGKVLIWRFEAERETEDDKFIKWQNIKVDAPTRTEFAMLPSGELLLYVLTQNPVSPLIVYIYEGISGFSEKMIGSLVPNVQYMNQFSIRNDHFIVLQNNDEINILQGVFKGHNFN